MSKLLAASLALSLLALGRPSPDSPASQRERHLHVDSPLGGIGPEDFFNCTKIFLDLGANRATHVRKLFEPLKYKGAKYLRVFNEFFGRAAYRSKPSRHTGICAFAFEANPRWRDRLREIELSYSAQGWRVRLFNVAVSGSDPGQLIFFNNNEGSDSDWGFSLYRYSDYRKPGNKTVTVAALDFSKFLQLLKDHAPPGKRLMKLDIEGGEFELLRSLIDKQLFCKNIVDLITLEWHLDSGLNTSLGTSRNIWYRQIYNEVMRGRACHGRPPTVWLFDDEEHLMDGQPLPT
ncbi:hypothetical protein AK812_SmicGene6130 [Symbiodinium microadriaticum]|uniref:Methyltransferase FkbM domain-containing protein n=1 Tax=Symbiodinium microadriaticum TaxID=2951 RepID=A0A1Q9ES33_SYMMI|nr:hypothetical protein AK812_SmicGene6130 [Symbiodinium microadriaticum]CAE7871421.1 unnamed protein product [Symbiodinium microadriaticum]CAE7879826.1 unnamed protein product [Symbiodinium sp. KB8]